MAEPVEVEPPVLLHARRLSGGKHPYGSAFGSGLRDHWARIEHMFASLSWRESTPRAQESAAIAGNAGTRLRRLAVPREACAWSPSSPRS